MVQREQGGSRQRWPGEASPYWDSRSRVELVFSGIWQGGEAASPWGAEPEFGAEAAG